MPDGESFVERCRADARRLQREMRARSQAPTSRAEACELVARANGFASWADLLRRSLPLVHCVTLYAPSMAQWLNHWFVAYDDAAASRARESGFLLPYRDQFFVTCADAIRELGLDPTDPDWARIGFDWVRPRDAEAHLRLCRARFAQMLARGEALP